MSTIKHLEDIQSCALPSFDIRREGLNIAAVVATLWPRHDVGSAAYVDIRDLPEHIRRDIGIMDGNRPTGGVKW